MDGDHKAFEMDGDNLETIDIEDWAASAYQTGVKKAAHNSGRICLVTPDPDTMKDIIDEAVDDFIKNTDISDKKDGYRKGGIMLAEELKAHMERKPYSRD